MSPGAAGAAETVEFTATLQVTRAADAYTRRKRDFDSVAPRPALGIVHPVISPDGTKVAFAAVGDIYVMPDRRQAGEHHAGSRARHRSRVVAGRIAARVLVGQEQRAPAAVDTRPEDGAEPSGDAPGDAAAGCGVVAGRQAHRVLQRNGHVAGGRDVRARRRDRHRHEAARHAAAAGRRRPGRRMASGSPSRKSRR